MCVEVILCYISVVFFETQCTCLFPVFFSAVSFRIGHLLLAAYQHHALWNGLFGTIPGYSWSGQMLRPAWVTHSFMLPIWLPCPRGDWLIALPISSCKLVLNDKAIRVAVGLRLGLNLCIPHQCQCGAHVDANSFVCKQAPLKWCGARAFSSAGISVSKEPAGCITVIAELSFWMNARWASRSIGLIKPIKFQDFKNPRCWLWLIFWETSAFYFLYF